MLSLRCLPLFLLVVYVLSPGCASKRIPKATAVRKEAPLFVGTVRLVNEQSRFVLIDSGAQPSPTAGATLVTDGAGGVAVEMKAADIRRRPFAIADLVSGTPQVGDRVYQQPLAPRAVPVATPAPSRGN